MVIPTVVVGLSTQQQQQRPQQQQSKKKKKNKPSSSIINIDSTTRTTESSSSSTLLISELQRCYTPKQILYNVGRYINPQIDPSGIVSSLILVRLSKQLISIDNNNNNYNYNNHHNHNHNDDDDDNDNKLVYEYLSNVIHSFSNSDWTTTQPNLTQNTKNNKNKRRSSSSTMIVIINESAIEGTKSASILSRLLNNMKSTTTTTLISHNNNDDDASSRATNEDFKTTTTTQATTMWLPILHKWNEIANNNDNNLIIVDKLEPQQLSGLKFAFDCFQQQISTTTTTTTTDDNNWILPKTIQKAYDELQLPFRIYPSLFGGGCGGDSRKNMNHHDNDDGIRMPSDDEHDDDDLKLTVSNLQKQVHFRLENIKTKSNTIVKERRQTAWEGDKHVKSFEYSGKSMKRYNWSPIVQKIRNELHFQTNQYYDCCLLNLYPDGGSAMRYHIDPDQGILWDYETAVVSVGATRRFAFREIITDDNNDNNKKKNCPPQTTTATTTTINNNNKPHVFTLMNGDVTEMFDDCQKRFQHTVKTAENKKENAARSSLVFKKSLLQRQQQQ